MELTVRPARPQDAAAALLYESARPYYNAYAGGEPRARALLEAVYPRRDHAASTPTTAPPASATRQTSQLAVWPPRGYSARSSLRARSGPPA